MQHCDGQEVRVQSWPVVKYLETRCGVGGGSFHVLLSLVNE